MGSSNRLASLEIRVQEKDLDDVQRFEDAKCGGYLLISVLHALGILVEIDRPKKPWKRCVHGAEKSRQQSAGKGKKPSVVLTAVDHAFLSLSASSILSSSPSPCASVNAHVHNTTEGV